MTSTLTDTAAHVPAHSSPPSTARVILRLTGTELRLMAREPMVAVGLIGFPVVTVLVLAGVFGTGPDPDFGGVAPDDHYLAGYVGVVLASLGVITLSVHIATNRELGVLRRYRASGLSARVLVGTELLVGALLGVLAATAVVVVGAAVYGLRAPEDVVGVAGWFLVGLACFMAIGVALGSVLPGGRSAGAVGNLVFIPLFLLGGGGPPRAVMTGPMQTISDALPLSHVIGGLRQSWLGTTDDPHVLWWPLSITVVAVVIAARHARRTWA